MHIRLGINHVCNGKSCLFQSNKVNSDNVMQHAAHFTFNKIQQILFYQVFEAKLNDMCMITMRALCIYYG